MKYHSIHNPQEKISFRDAVQHGLAPDGSLYMPEAIPMFSSTFLKQASECSLQQIGVEVATPFLDQDFSTDEINSIVYESITFDCPLISIGNTSLVLELFHGPTLAFKDVGARFLAQVLQAIAVQSGKEITVLVATSGDTGSAVAHAFHKMDGIQTILLYPENRVSDLQEKQFATLGDNILSVKISGSFDDCQRLVKTAFLDNDVRNARKLTSANSINIARLIPQIFYYVLAWSRVNRKEPLYISVPSGNFGNLTAGLIAKKMGVPITHFIAATNRNDIVPEYLRTNEFKPRESAATISNAMDVGNPSNFTRMMHLYDHNRERMKKDITGYSFSDEETRAIIKRVHREYDYIMDPHGAIGYLGLMRYQQRHQQGTGIFLETAHPAKFNETIEQVLNQPAPIPESLQRCMKKQVLSIACSSQYDDFKSVLLSRYTT